MIINEAYQIDDKGVKHKMISIEVLQEIRQEIADAKLPNDDEICKANNYGLNTALVIIDKYIKQIEGSDTE